MRIYDFETGIGHKLPIGEAAGRPIWSPDGNRIIFAMQNRRAFGISDVEAGAGFTERSHFVARAVPSFWSNTGLVLFNQLGGIFSLSEGSDEPENVVSAGGAWGAEASRDGRWIAYASSVTGRSEIRISSLPKGTVNRQVSTDGGFEPVWCRGCDELFYRNGNRWYASKIRFEPELSIGIPRLVFDVPGFVDTSGRSYDITRDGQRLLVLVRVNEPTRTKLHLVQNWFAELERIVPRKIVED